MRIDISTKNESNVDGIQQFDVVIIGAGFSGCYLLHKLRGLGFKVCVIDAAPNVGGVWQWNRYPGARVDSHVPLYELSIPEIWKSWNWSQRYPSGSEVLAYFHHLDKELDLAKDMIFETKVTTAKFCDENNTWSITTDNGANLVSTYFIPAMGFAAKRVFPNWQGIEHFKGEIHHSSFWPADGVDVRDKRVAVVGTGSTGIQIIQELGPIAKEMTVFQRTPNYCLPMHQQSLTPEMQESARADYPAKFAFRLLSAGGYDANPEDVNTFDHTAAERRSFYEDKWSKGDFSFLIRSYKDLMVDPVANREAYDFWAQKVRPMLDDPEKREILAPLEPPHPFGTRRTALFTTFYEVMDQPNVNIVPVKHNPIECLTETGIVTRDGKHHDFDVIALATGFDAVTGGLKQITVEGIDGINLNEKWSNGTSTLLGLMSAGFPNMFFVYGPQGPTALSNGPACIEIQSDWIADYLVYARDQKITRIDADPESEQNFSKLLNDHTNQTLFILDDSPYVGGNIDGKIREGLNWIAGIPEYARLIGKSAANNYEGFKLSK
ncbi:hypothetical protein N7475_008019 [Penicillium sp. IBT 31633x]|nr:hypothetical protein N7475_008019 [Penicillium sp. IBT 31633x]